MQYVEMSFKSGRENIVCQMTLVGDDKIKLLAIHDGKPEEHGALIWKRIEPRQWRILYDGEGNVGHQINSVYIGTLERAYDFFINESLEKELFDV